LTRRSRADARTDPSELKSFIRDIPDFPSPGIVFKDITPLLGDQQAFARVIDLIAERFVGLNVNRVVGIEARGFIIAAPVAYRLALWLRGSPPQVRAAAPAQR